MSWAAVAVAGVSLAVGVGTKIHNNNVAKKKERANKRPTYNTPSEINDNQSLAAQNAQQGLSDASMQVALDNANQQYSGSIDALLKAGGGLNSVSDLYDTFGNNLKDLVGLDDEMRLKNQQIFMGANEEVAASRDKEFQFNKYAPFADQAQRIAELRAQGNAAFQAGITGASGALSGIAGRERGDGGDRSNMGMDSMDTTAGMIQPKHESANIQGKPLSTNYLLQGRKWSDSSYR